MGDETTINWKSYEIRENPRGGGDKMAKIQGRPYKIIEIPRGASKLDHSRGYGKKQVLTPPPPPPLMYGK